MHDREESRRKMNKIKIFLFGFLELGKSLQNLLSGYSNGIAKEGSLQSFLHSSTLFSWELLLYLMFVPRADVKSISGLNLKLNSNRYKTIQYNTIEQLMHDRVHVFHEMTAPAL